MNTEQNDSHYLHIGEKIILLPEKQKGINYKEFQRAKRIEEYERKLNIRKIKEYCRNFNNKHGRKPDIKELKEYQKSLPIPHFSTSELYFIKEGKPMTSENETIEEHKEKVLNRNKENSRGSEILTEQEKGEL